MRSIIIGSCVVLFTLATMASGAPADADVADYVEFKEPGPKPHYNLDEAPALFDKFIKDFEKNYKDEAEKQVHYEAFVNSLETINKLNSNPNDTASYGINNFSDYTEEQRKRMFGLRID